jgi:uncharacterized membrane protein YdcZ (DUF606 family)
LAFRVALGTGQFLLWRAYRARLLLVLDSLAGAVLPVQGALNGLLRQTLGAPLAVGTVSFTVATLATATVPALALAFTDHPKPNLAGLKKMPWWGWLGGLGGAIYVTTVFSAIPMIGAAAVVGLRSLVSRPPPSSSTTTAGSGCRAVRCRGFAWPASSCCSAALLRLS